MIHRDPWAVVTYTDRLPAFVKGGITLWRFIFIRPKYRGDEGLLRHELTHVRQGWRMLLYPFPKYRLRLEVEAYREQMKWYRTNTVVEIFAHYLVNDYGLKITLDEARRLLIDAG